MTSTQRVLSLDNRLWIERGGEHADTWAAFGQTEVDLENEVEVTLPITLWRDMGEPEFITVRVEPGDRLNS